MIASSFQSGSLLHIATLAVCLAIAVAIPPLSRRPDRERPTRRIIGWGCLAAWILNTGYWLMPERFHWDSSLPLHFCNVANIFGTLAVLRRIRLFQSVIYFWAALYIWAFLTPTVGVGPAHAGYWVFWIYHLFVVLALVHVVFIDRFRPTFRDLRNAAAFTLAYVALLATLDSLTGWNYGFLGPATPKSPTLVDVLGPYPLRILWMILLGALLFAALWLPFRFRPARPS